MNFEAITQTMTAALVRTATKGTIAPLKPGTYLVLFVDRVKDDKQQDVEKASYDTAFYDTRTPAGWQSKAKGRAAPAYWWPLLGAPTLNVLLKSK